MDKTVAIIGAGQMGSGIAQTVAAHGMDVLLADVSLDVAEKAHAGIDKAFGKLVGKGKIEIADAEGFHRPPLLNFFMSRYTQAYANEIAAFVAAVAQGAATPTTGQDGLMALALAEAALKSVAEGRAVKLAEVLDGA